MIGPRLLLSLYAAHMYEALYDNKLLNSVNIGAYMAETGLLRGGLHGRKKIRYGRLETHGNRETESERKRGRNNYSFNGSWCSRYQLGKG